MFDNEKIFLHALRSLPFIGDATLRNILEVFESPEAAWHATSIPMNLALSPSMRKTFLEKQNIIPNPEELFEKLKTESIILVTEDEDGYPKALLEIPDRPHLLYMRGNYDWSQNALLLAVVGSRKITSYGKEVTEKLVSALTQAGVTIVSGLAFGIDKTAHETALRNDGQTIAVLGSGIDDNGITPTTHKKLGLEVTKHGALISEFPPGTIPSPANFPLRNRIIAGLTIGTLVIEAAEKSGSLITARLALDYNREVFTVPGSIFSVSSQGTNALLKMGAIPVTSSKDILDALLLSKPGTQGNLFARPILPESEAKLVSLLSLESLHINNLAQQSGLPIHEVSALLLVLELKQYVKHIGNQTYIAIS